MPLAHQGPLGPRAARNRHDQELHLVYVIPTNYYLRHANEKPEILQEAGALGCFSLYQGLNEDPGIIAMSIVFTSTDISLSFL